MLQTVTKNVKIKLNGDDLKQALIDYVDKHSKSEPVPLPKLKGHYFEIEGGEDFAQVVGATVEYED